MKNKYKLFHGTIIYLLKVSSFNGYALVKYDVEENK